MNRSIATRLAAMFAVAALLVFSVVGAGLSHVLQQELQRHQLNELNTRFDLLQRSIVRSDSAEKWQKMSAKLEAVTPGDGSTQFWVLSNYSRFEYGAASAELRRQLAGRSGLGSVRLIGELRAMRTRTKTIAANGERPEVQFTVAIDSTRFHETLRTFAIALILLSVTGVALVTVLGHWIARMGLRPLGRLSQEAEALSPRNLAQRLHLTPMPKELSNLVSSFNGALDRLEGAYAQLEAFNADVAHEMRTPLTNLIGQTQVVLSRERTAPQFEEVLQSNLEELERLRAIVNDMLFLARADQGETATARSSASIREEIDKAVEFLEVILDEANVTVKVVGDAHAAIEKSLFHRAVTNLVQNAIQHSPAGTEIEVHLSEQKGSVQIAVSNPGAHIAEEHLVRLFDRFYRVDSSRRNSRENHGLGLSIVKAIASMHGGTVFASSNAGHTTIGFTLAH